MSYRGDRFADAGEVFVAATTLYPNLTFQFDTSGGAIAQPLPDADALRAGDFIWVKLKAGSAALTVQPAGGDTIDGSASAVTVAASAMFLRDSTTNNWVKLGSGAGETLDDAYNFGGSGAGRTINVVAGLPVTLVTTAIGTAQTRDLYIRNTTPAANGAQQYSPVLSLEGRGWTGAASQLAEMALQTVPVQGSPVTARLAILSAINGAALAEVASVSSNGNFLSAAGSASAPGYAVGDAANGIYRSAADVVSVAQAGTLAASFATSAITLARNTVPDATGTRDLGASGTRWATQFAYRSNLAPAAASSGTPTPIQTVTGPAHTGLSIAEAIDIDWTGLARTVTFGNGGGTLTLQRAVAIGRPTYAAAAALTITDASSFDIQGAPVAGSNVTLTRTWGLSVGRDTDTATVLGRARIDARATDTAYFSHYDQSASDQYALLQTSLGETHVNARSGQELILSVGDAAKMRFTGTACTVAVPVSPTTSGGQTLGTASLPWGNAFFAGRIRNTAGANEQATVGAAGGASALPATPLGYLLMVNSAGNNVAVPYYNP